MEFLVENWPLLIAAGAVIAVAATYLISFFKMPGSAQLDKVREWLLFAVTQAEKELGGGTGQIKLRYVYDMFVVKFPSLVKFISFETFSFMVDEALIKMRHFYRQMKKLENTQKGMNNYGFKWY